MRELINAFNGAGGASFVAFTYTNKYGEKASRLIQINTIYENALKKDLEIIPNVEFEEGHGFDRATFITAQAELLKSANLSLGNKEGANKTDVEQHATRSKAQSDAYVQIAKNIKFNIETGQLYIFAKEVRKTVLEEGNYPTVNRRAKTVAKNFIKKSMKSSKYRTYIIPNVTAEGVKVNGDTIELG
jgi:hypothetical protein